MSNSDSKRFYTYLHHRLDTMQVFYVGKGHGRRKNSDAGRNKHWRHIANKYGYIVEIAAYWPTEDEAFEHEIFLIDTLRSMGFGLANISSGGQGRSGVSPSPEQRLANSARTRAMWQNPEMRAQILQKLTDPAARKRHSERMRKLYEDDPQRRVAASKKQAEFLRTPDGMEALRKSNEAKRKDDFRRNQSQVGRARAATPQGREAMAKMTALAAAPQAIKKALASRALKMLDPIHREKLAAAHGAKPFVCIETGQTFLSQTIACETLGLSKPKLCQVLSGKRRSTKGYSFAFISESIQAPL